MIKLNTKISVKKAKKALRRADELSKTIPSKFDKMTKAQVLAELRKTREKLWNERLKARH